jgi:hypothetical protein
MSEMRKSKFWFETSGRSPLRRIWSEWEGNIKMILTESGRKGVEWGERVQDRVQWKVKLLPFKTSPFIVVKGKGKIVLILILIEYHIMKAYWGSEDIAPLILSPQH